MRKITSLFALLLLFVGGAWAQDWTPNLASGSLISVGEKVSSVTSATSADDNDHWYIITQVRGGESVAFARGTNERLRRGSTAQTAASFSGTDANTNAAYIVRFISTGSSDLYKMQFGNGYFVNSSLMPGATSVSDAATYAFYNSNGGSGSYFGWNLNSKSGSIVDNNAAGNDLAFWSSGTVSGTSGNNVWYVYSVSIQDANNFVNVTYNVEDGGSVVATQTVQQEKNSAVSIPVALTSNTTIYDYTASGSIGDTDCTITIVRTLKNGVVTNISDISNSKLYTLTPYDASRGLLSASASEAALNTKGANTKFALYTYEGNTYLYNFSAGKFVDNQSQLSGVTGYYFPLVDNPTSTVAVAAANYEYTFTLKMNGANCINASNGWSYGAVGNWNTLDNGNQFYVIAVEDMTSEQSSALATLMDSYFHPSYLVTYVVKDTDNNTLYTSAPVGTTLGAHITDLPDEYKRSLFYNYNTVDVTIAGNSTTVEFTATPKSDAPFKFTADATAPVWNHLTMRPDGSANTSYPTYVAGGTPNVTLPATNADDESTMWAFIGNPYNGFQIVNRAAGTSLVLGSASADGDGNSGGNTYATLAAPGSQTYEVWTITGSSLATGGFFINNAAGQYLNKRSSANLAYWTGGHDIGSTFVAAEVLEGAALYDALITQLEAINWGPGANQYQLTGSLAGYAGNEAALISQLKSEGYSAENLAGAQAMLENRALNLPAPGFYRIKGNTSGKYLAAGKASNGKFAMTDATDATTVFYFDGSKLVNYSTGMSNGMNRNDWEWVTIESASVVTFQDGLTNGGYGIKSAADAGGTLNANFYDNGDGTGSADRGGNVTINSGTNARYASWYLEAVNELPLTLTDLSSYGVSGCYTTMYMPVNVQVTGATVYAVTGATGNSLNVEEITDGVVPANTGVILEGTATSATAMVCTTASTATSVLNGSVGVTEIVPTNTYVLSVANDKLGFYKFEGTQLKGFRTYYMGTSPDPTRGFVLNFGETTGINAATLNGEGNAYDLQGRRVQNAQKGIFIINGKKVVK